MSLSSAELHEIRNRRLANVLFFIHVLLVLFIFFLIASFYEQRNSPIFLSNIIFLLVLDRILVVQCDGLYLDNRDHFSHAYRLFLKVCRWMFLLKVIVIAGIYSPWYVAVSLSLLALIWVLKQHHAEKKKMDR
jgi:hypothetical protein